MEKFNLYKDIQARTKGEIFLGVVGPVRTGKSTFVRRFMEQMVLPNLAEHEQKVATDELPMSGTGKTVMTVEPKFVPKEAAEIMLADDISIKVRLVDCVGFLVDGVTGISDENGQRMVRTPWSTEEMPFAKAAELGTGKVIRDHSTVGIVVTTDGSFGEMKREQFLEAEKRTILESRKTGKPFIVIVNSERPYADEAKQATAYLENTYGIAAMAVNCEQLKQDDIRKILERILYEFPVAKMEFYVPKWTEMLAQEHPIRTSLLTNAGELLQKMSHMRGITNDSVQFMNPYVKKVKLDGILLSEGTVKIQIDIDDTYYYEMLSEMAGVPIQGEYQLISMIRDLSGKKKSFEEVESAMQKVRGCGYGVIKPERDEIQLAEPEVMKHGSKFGVKIRAASPTIHLIKADIETEIAPIVGSEQQAEDLIAYIKENGKGEDGIWATNIFGKSIEQLVEDGIRTKLAMIGDESQMKLQETMKKVVNDSSGRIICIII